MTLKSMKDNTLNDITVYHNPRCSKSCGALELLRDRGIRPHIVEYLTETPDIATLRVLADQLGVRPIDMVRTKEPIFKELGLDAHRDDDAAILAAIAAHPILLERPIVVRGRRATIARPPAKVLELLT